MMIRRVVVHRCPAVPTAPKRIARTARSRFASSVTMIPLFPPSSRIVRPRRRATASAARRPMRTDPVKLTSGNRGSLIIRSPIVAPGPITRLKTPSSPPSTWKSAHTWLVTCWTAIAHRATAEAGFQTIVSPQTAAMAAFHDQTAVGKLNAVMMPTAPRGCHCSYMRWPARSECVVTP